MPATDPILPGPALGGAVLPLHGVTLLLVEDSRYVSDALRLMAQRSGARLRRAGSLGDARRHLGLYRPDLVIVDMGLPDGSGAALIAELARSGQVPVLGLSGDPDLAPLALRAGACGFLEKPLPGLAGFQRRIADVLPGLERLLPVPEPLVPLSADPLGLREDLGEAARRLSGDPDRAERQYLATFLCGLARVAGDGALARAADSLIDADAQELDRIRGLVSLRLGQQPRAFA